LAEIASAHSSNLLTYSQLSEGRTLWNNESNS